MNTLVVVVPTDTSQSQTDITPYIKHKSYKMQKTGQYESWEDGNWVEHRIYTRSKISGSFEVWLCGMNGMDTDAFLTLWNSAIVENVVTLGVFVPTDNSMSVINAYYKMTPSKHDVLSNGTYYNVFKIEVTER